MTPQNDTELIGPQKILSEQLEIKYGDRVGDLGCGCLGFFTFQAAKMVGDGGTVYAVDIIKEHLKRINSLAKEQGLNNIVTLWSDLESFGTTKINNNTLDFCFLVNVLFQNKLPDKIIKEALRLLKTGGQLLIIDWREGRFSLGPKPQLKISKEKVLNLTTALGLKYLKEFNAGPYHYGLILEKIV